MRNASKALGTTWKRNSFSLIRALGCVRVVHARILIRRGGLVGERAGSSRLFGRKRNSEEDRLPRASPLNAAPGTPAHADSSPRLHLL